MIIWVIEYPLAIDRDLLKIDKKSTQSRNFFTAQCAWIESMKRTKSSSCVKVKILINAYVPKGYSTTRLVWSFEDIY